MKTTKAQRDSILELLNRGSKPDDVEIRWLVADIQELLHQRGEILLTIEPVAKVLGHLLQNIRAARA